MAIFLTVLKIIGIVLIAIIGLILFILLLVLFVPFRYRVDFDNREEMKVFAHVTWLLHFISVYYVVGDNNPLKIKVLGIHINKGGDKEKPEKEKKDKKAEEAGEAEKAEELHSSEISLEEDSKWDSDKDLDMDSDMDKELASDVTFSEEDQEKAAGDEAEDSKEKKVSFITKIKNILLKLKGISDKIKSGISNFKDKMVKKVEDLKKKLAKLMKKMGAVKEFITSEDFEEFLPFAWDVLVKILKHIWPRKLKGAIKLGTGEPDSTGLVLGAIGAAEGMTGTFIEIEPDFDNQVFEGYAFAKGRIYLFYLVYLGIKFILDDRWKRFYARYKRLKKQMA